MDRSWVEILAKAASGKPGTIRDRLLSEDKSQRYKQVADLVAEIDQLYPNADQALRIDGWLNRIDFKGQLLPDSAVHDIHWNKSTEVQVGNFELHIGPKRAAD
jgi:hypothetical protein